MDGSQLVEDAVPGHQDFDRLPKMDRSKLRGFERLTVPICDAINGTFWLKRFVQFFVRTVTASWIFFICRKRLVFHGLDHVRELKPPRGVILVSNHRSFFDMYVCSAVLYKRASFLSRIHFPVRSRFFYTNPVGLLVNISVSGCAMWPPVFRDARKKTFNPTGMRQISYILSRPGSMLGYHPEGTRGKGPDPYALLPTKKGIGMLVEQCHPETLLIPFFILGMGSSLPAELKAWLRPRRGVNDIRLHFGEPVPVSALQTGASSMETAEKVMDLVRVLAEQDKLGSSP